MGQGTLLVVEDNAYNMKLVRSLLQLGGYQVIEAETAEQGLDLAREHRPEAVLMDIQLPGMDGLTATGKLKEDPETKDIPVLALTAYAMEGDEQKALASGCVGYISKPLDTKSFLQTLQGHIPSLSKDQDETDDPGDGSVSSDQTGLREDLFFKDRILVVDDDDPVNVKLLTAKLPRDSYEALKAYSGQECLDAVYREHPNLILLDLMMPGIDGFEVTRRLKKDEKTRDIPIIHITALDSEADKARGLEAGADEFLNKPIVASESANWHTDEAFSLAVKLLREHGPVDAIFCANDKMALGALQALDLLGYSNGTYFSRIFPWSRKSGPQAMVSLKRAAPSSICSRPCPGRPNRS